jgi:hypothetical protein
VGPCPVIAEKRYPLLELGSWEKAYKTLLTDYGNNYQCKKTCFLPCYLETSTLMIHPWQSLKELFQLKVRLKKGDKIESVELDNGNNRFPVTNIHPDPLIKSAEIPEAL